MQISSMPSLMPAILLSALVWQNALALSNGTLQKSISDVPPFFVSSSYLQQATSETKIKDPGGEQSSGWTLTPKTNAKHNDEPYESLYYENFYDSKDTSIKYYLPKGSILWTADVNARNILNLMEESPEGLKRVEVEMISTESAERGQFIVGMFAKNKGGLLNPVDSDVKIAPPGQNGLLHPHALNSAKEMTLIAEKTFNVKVLNKAGEIKTRKINVHESLLPLMDGENFKTLQECTEGNKNCTSYYQYSLTSDVGTLQSETVLIPKKLGSEIAGAIRALPAQSHFAMFAIVFAEAFEFERTAFGIVQSKTPKVMQAIKDRIRSRMAELLDQYYIDGYDVLGIPTRRARVELSGPNPRLFIKDYDNKITPAEIGAFNDRRYNPEDVVVSFDTSKVDLRADEATDFLQIIDRTTKEVLFTDYDTMVKRNSDGTVAIIDGRVTAGYKADNWANPLAHCAFTDVLQTWNRKEGDSSADVIQWGDFSFPVPGLTENGHDPLEHSSHSDANCVDVRPFVSTKSSGSIAQDRNTNYTDGNYFSESSAKFIALAVSKGAYTIYFNDSKIVKTVENEVNRLVEQFQDNANYPNLKDGLSGIKLEQMPAHDNHFHICFATDGRPERTKAYKDKWPRSVKQAAFQRSKMACANLSKNKILVEE